MTADRQAPEVLAGLPSVEIEASDEGAGSIEAGLKGSIAIASHPPDPRLHRQGGSVEPRARPPACQLLPSLRQGQRGACLRIRELERQRQCRAHDSVRPTQRLRQRDPPFGEGTRARRVTGTRAGHATRNVEFRGGEGFEPRGERLRHERNRPRVVAPVHGASHLGDQRAYLSRRRACEHGRHRPFERRRDGRRESAGRWRIPPGAESPCHVPTIGIVAQGGGAQFAAVAPANRCRNSIRCFLRRRRFRDRRRRRHRLRSECESGRPDREQEERNGQAAHPPRRIPRRSTARRATAKPRGSPTPVPADPPGFAGYGRRWPPPLRMSKRESLSDTALGRMMNRRN